MISRSSFRPYRILLTTHVRPAVSLRANSSYAQAEIKGNYDVIIAGGGMVGCTLACSLGKNSLLSNLKVLLLEGSPNKKFELSRQHSNRVVALNQNTKALMNSLKIWRHIEDMRLQPVRHMQVWDACSDALITFDSADIMGDDVAYIVENDVLLHAVNMELTSPDVSNVNIVFGAKIAGYNLAKENDTNLVKLNNGDVYSCNLLVLAALSFFATGSYQKPIGMSYMHAMSQPSVSVCTQEVTRALNNANLLSRHIKFPQTHEERLAIVQGFYDKFGMPGVLGCVDGTHVALIRPTEHEERFYNRKRYHSRNVQIIGADGANSAVRQAMGVQYLTWSYEQLGVVATLELSEEADNNTAWQRFLPSGPIALLPLDGKHSSLVWSTSPGHAKQLLGLPDEQFVDALNDALALYSLRFQWKQYPRAGIVESCMTSLAGGLRRLGLADGVSRQLPPSVCAVAPHSRACFPLAAGHSTRYVAANVALVGDAAHRVHPLAGQGVNLGFGDVRHLTEFLADAVYTGLDITHPSWLEKYESTRQKHNVPTQLAIEAIHRLYSVDLPPLVLARSLGLQLTNALHPIKKLIMSHAVAT